MCFGSRSDYRSHSEWPARPIELQPLSIQQSSPPRRVRVPLSATSGSSSSSPVYIRDPVDWSTRPDVLARHRQYKAADFRSSADKRRYKTERRQRKVVKAYQTRTYAPRGLTIESHQHLAPVARRWHGSATQHADLREGFLTDYPRAYKNKASVRTHREAISNARNSAAKAEKFVEEHIRYGSLTHMTISIIAPEVPKEQVQGSAMITTNSVAAVKSSTTRGTRLWTDKREKGKGLAMPDTAISSAFSH